MNANLSMERDLAGHNTGLDVQLSIQGLMKLAVKNHHPPWIDWRWKPASSASCLTVDRD
jgi:hypothetical protein